MTTFRSGLGHANERKVVASILAGFVLSYRHLSSVISNLAGYTEFPQNPIRLETPVESHREDPVTGDDGDGEPFPITLVMKRVLKSVTNAALLIDIAILVVFLLSFNEYTLHIIWGRAIPFCTLFNHTHKWADLKVIDKECIISQCAWVSSIFAM